MYIYIHYVPRGHQPFWCIYIYIYTWGLFPTFHSQNNKNQQEIYTNHKNHLEIIKHLQKSSDLYHVCITLDALVFTFKKSRARETLET